MIPTDLETKLDALLADADAQAAAIQEAYRSTRGRYWQGARTHTVPPADGAKTAPDLTRKPTDQAESWAAFGLALPAQIEAALSVDVYQTRAGHGWVINADVIVAGVYHRRALNHGPEGWRAHGWKEFKRSTM